MASKRGCADIRAARDNWIEQRQPKIRHGPHRLTFLDETAVTTKLTRLLGRSLCGTRLPGTAPYGHWKTQTFIAGLRCHELTSSWIVDGAMDRTAFDLWIETQFTPTLPRGDVVILDNLQVHKSAKAASILKARGAWFLVPPATSPDLNPIEMAFAKLKAHLRAAKARTFDALWKAVGNLCNLFSRQSAGTSSNTQAMRAIKRSMLQTKAAAARYRSPAHLIYWNRRTGSIVRC